MVPPPVGVVILAIIVPAWVRSDIVLWETVNERGEEGPPDAGFNIVTCAVPDAAMSLAGMAAVSRVALTKVVGRLDPFHCTVKPEAKLVPFTVRVNGAPPLTAVVGDMELRVGTGVLWDTVNERGEEEPPPDAGFNPIKRFILGLTHWPYTLPGEQHVFDLTVSNIASLLVSLMVWLLVLWIAASAIHSLRVGERLGSDTAEASRIAILVFLLGSLVLAIPLNLTSRFGASTFPLFFLSMGGAFSAAALSGRCVWLL